MNAPASVVLCALLTLPTLALAQGAATSTPPVKDKAPVVFSEIERGLYFGVYGGPSYLLAAPTPDATDTLPKRDGPFSSGVSAQIEVGYDFNEFLSVGVFLLGSFQRAGSDYLGFSEGTQTFASGDFSILTPGISARAHLVGFADSQEVKRTWFYVRGGAGYSLFAPEQLIPDPDILVFAGPGVEYYTRLRHFSVGLEVTGSMLVSTGTFGFAVSPNLRYAF